MEAIDVMKQLYANHHRGPIGPEIEKQMLAEQQMAQAEVAETQQEAEVGLDDGQGLRPMIIPGAESIRGAQDGPIDLTTIDQQTGLVASHIPNVQPGELVNTGEGVDVLETPSLPMADFGGSYKSIIAENMRNYKRKR